MKRILATLILTCVLTVSAIAGEIPTCNCKSVTVEFPGPGTAPPGQEYKPVPGVDSSTELNETESSLLTTVLLTLVSLAVR